MPYQNEHAARLTDPDKYKSFSRENDKLGKGIDVIYGITKAGKSEIQAIRFDKTKFTPQQAKDWLKAHKEFKPIEFEAAKKNGGS
jgi:hypothetical protein